MSQAIRFNAVEIYLGLRRTNVSNCPKIGFTLIELLVTVTVIAVLASMLLPTISMVRESALGTRCASNLRQIHLGSLLYSQDWKGYMLPCQTESNYWSTSVAPYLESTAGQVIVASDTRQFLRSCPRWKNTSSYQGSITVASQYQHGGYGWTTRTRSPMPGWNAAGLWVNGDGNLFAGAGGYLVRLATVSKQSERLVGGDWYNYAMWSPYLATPTWSRHGPKANGLYFDGHSERVDKAGYLAGQNLAQ